MTNLVMLLDIAVIVLAAKLAGVAASKIGQPTVVAEIAVSVLLGVILQFDEVTAPTSKPARAG